YHDPMNNLRTFLIGAALVATVPALLTPSQAKETTAQWIVPPEAPPTDYGVFLFRRTFDLADVPKEMMVDVTAHQRYRLFVSGEEVSMGPAAGNLKRWRYETVDLAPQLREGKNVISAQVWNMGPDTPAIQISHRTAFRFQTQDDEFRHLNSNHEWRVMRC